MATSTPSPSLEGVLVADVKASITTHPLVVLITAVLLVTGAVYGVDSLRAKDAAVNDAKWAAVLKTVQGQNQTLQQKYQDDTVAAGERDAALQQTIAQQGTLLQQQSAALAKLLAKDATLTAQQAATQIGTQTGGTVTATGNDVTLDLNASRTVAADLDRLKTAQENLDATNASLAAQKGLTDDANTKLVDANNVIASDKVLAGDAAKKCSADINDAKAVARKSKVKWFIAGYIAGLITGHVTIH